MGVTGYLLYYYLLKYTKLIGWPTVLLFLFIGFTFAWKLIKLDLDGDGDE